MKKILFICTGNTCRSPMAQGLFNKICADRDLHFTSESAGLCTITGLPVAGNSVKAAADRGVDISSFSSTSIEDVRVEDYALFAVMTREHRDVLESFGIPSDKIYILAENTGGISDPYGGSEARYRQCCDEISLALEELVRKLGEE